MPEEEKMLGRILFGQEIFVGPNYAYLRPLEEANSLEEIKARLFLLKLDTPIEAAAYVLEKIFAGFSEILDSRDLRSWALGRLWRGDRPEFENKFVSFILQCRKVIGSLALEVFFDAVFEKDKEAFWSYLVASPHNCDWWSDYHDKPAATVIKETFNKEIFSFPIFPRALVVYLQYFSVGGGNAKIIYRTQIKRFLKRVLDAPLEPSYEGQKLSVGVSKWSEKARRELARTLVVNGLYEECLDYNIPEALEPMSIKFCGGQKELPEGFVYLSEVNTTMDAAQAMKKACEDKEWGHMWSVITRLAFKHGNAEFLYYWPQMQKDASSAQQAKLALVWKYPVLRYSMDPKFIGL